MSFTPKIHPTTLENCDGIDKSTVVTITISSPSISLDDTYNLIDMVTLSINPGQIIFNDIPSDNDDNSNDNTGDDNGEDDGTEDENSDNNNSSSSNDDKDFQEVATETSLEYHVDIYKNAGKVAIGNTIPQSKLHVTETEASAVSIKEVALFERQLTGTAAAQGGALSFSVKDNSASNKVAQFVWNQESAGSPAGTLTLKTNNGTSFQDSLTIKSNQRIGISNTTPASKLDVGGTITSTGFNIS